MHIFAILTILFVPQVFGIGLKKSTKVAVSPQKPECPQIPIFELESKDSGKWGAPQAKLVYLRKDVHGCVYKAIVKGVKTYIVKTPAPPAMDWDGVTLQRIFAGGLLVPISDKSILFPHFTLLGRQWLVFNQTPDAVPLEETPLYQKYGPSGRHQKHGSPNIDCLDEFLHVDVAAQIEIERLEGLDVFKANGTWMRNDFYYDISKGYEDAVAFATNVGNIDPTSAQLEIASVSSG
ncbi:hypothetical protein FRC03_003621 [Tulasnella sp. 419]|nr:hypothetical protein FRC03_003621 [Tulasnella sp. 419]